ncbi:glycine cleavage system protein R [Shewanella sp. NIFS-20-20]|uniref:glycine cleavage system protein R n=1 Tax=Shewanella sp. NIFS-20-20 TaxID=2853806 RepID=UPI001C480C08|nr:ACT domain-containing protein [Shewanella sp. NIFS-20-20]MBV7317019.1 glycine cleavage system transcriptional repressor [Shewanella sp. NIFS-20-20]
MTNYLVVTAMGADRPGLVSKLSRLASDCECDIIDSRMALFGNEFTLIMMMAGSWSAITKIETSLPQLSVELDLLTVMKRTSKHTPPNFVSRIEVSLQGKDQRGSIKRITEFLAERGLDIAAFRSHSEDANLPDVNQHMYLAINIPEKVDLEKLEQQLQQLADEMHLSLSIKRMQGS